MQFKCGCGDEFKTTFERFNRRNKRQCNKCGRLKGGSKDRIPFKEVKDFIEIESNSGCELLSTNYKNNRDKLDIRCACGDTFTTDYDKFKNRSKQQCNECGYQNISDFFTYEYSYVKETIETTSNCKLLSETYVGCYEPLNLLCHCGKEFEISFINFNNRDGKQCNHCNNLFSRGELRVENFLVKEGLKYEPQYTFEDLKSEN